MVRRLVAFSLGLGVVLVPLPAVALPQTYQASWQTNGQVLDIVEVDGTIFIGGDFTQLREKPSTETGGEVIPVDNFGAVDAATGNPIPGMDLPRFTGTGDVVRAITLAGGKLWVGGKFTSVDGAARRNLAAFDPDTLELLNIRPRTGGAVLALTSDGSKLYAGGKFKWANGTTRNHIAAFEFDGALDAGWNPSANDAVVDMAVTEDDTGLFITGEFKQVSGQDRNSIARLNTANGNLTDWEPEAPPGGYSLTIRGNGVNVYGNRVYWAVAESDWAAAFHADSGDRFFKTDTDGTVNDIVEVGDRVIIGGHFVRVAYVPGPNPCAADPSSCDFHSKIAALELNGVLDEGWTAGLQGKGSEWQGAKRFLVDGNTLWIGGAFLAIDEDMPRSGSGGAHDQTYFGRLS